MGHKPSSITTRSRNIVVCWMMTRLKKQKLMAPMFYFKTKRVENPMFYKRSKEFKTQSRKH